MAKKEVASILMVIGIIIVVLISGCSEQMTDEKLQQELNNLSDEELNYVLSDDSETPNLSGQASRQKYQRLMEIRKNPKIQQFRKATINCRDSDGGSNYQEAGFVTLLNYPGGVIDKHDKCWRDGVKLQEYVCEGGRYKGDHTYDCSKQGKTCENGACITSHCSDGIYNAEEEGLDCGWTCPNECNFVEKSGTLNQNEIWEGNIFVNGYVEVPEGITLTIQPGTIVKFKYSRDYKNLDKGGLGANGGTIKAIGTPQKQIWFTSNAPDPINGDWNGISIEDSSNSEFKYVIVEYGEMGIEQFDSAASIRNSIIRWTNAEGLYAEKSEPIFENNLLYGNGYHEIALEQYNTNVQIKNNIFHDGAGWAIHHEKTESFIEGNYFYNYEKQPITAGMESTLTITKNRFRDVPENAFNIYDGSIATIEDNDFGDNTVPIPNLNFENNENFKLNYLPGDSNDKYPYIFDDEDETRKIVKKLGGGIGFGWAITFKDNYLYRFSIGGGELGESLDFIRINPENGETIKYANDEIMNPRGLTHDEEYFYVNDFSLLKIFKFKLENNEFVIYNSFDIPFAEQGGTNGLTTDGEYLYLRSRNGEKLYQITKTGELVDELYIPGGPVVWTGEYFWTMYSCEKGMCKYNKSGQLVGEIYPVAQGPWAVDWDGEHLWTIQRTCENWDDPKIYQIEILDDSLSETSLGCIGFEDYIVPPDERDCCEGLVATECTQFCPNEFCCDPGELICLEE
ncbi:MAG: right-handed parallel beta-helix repeat-containing protein [Nanoarchaeota archaeon]|nr:right-handed parallel beta-helix repeat-containing protein [Nanoarchaeota archaeon]MBU1622945.1 right-handed parallel beta-helix repeat-containing protein [Nanoarchaeota archaeon]